MNSIPDPPHPSHDEALMQRIAQRDEAALAELYDRYGALLYSLALRMVGTSEIAEEVLQDALLAVWRSAWMWDAGKSSLQAWLVTITRHRAIDALRKTKTRTPVLPLQSDLTSDEPSPDEAFFSEAASRQVREALGELPVQLREVLEVVYFAGLSHREAAERLGIPPGTVKSRLRLALERMGRRLRARGLWR